MREIIMGYQGEMSLKGLNRNQFESAMMKILRYRLKTVGKFKVYCTQSTFYMEPEEEDVDMDLAFDRVRTVFGLAALSRAVVCEKDFDTICRTAEEYLGDSLHGIKPFDKSQIDSVILDAASVVCNTDGMLTDVFNKIIGSNRSMLRPVENVTYEDSMGLSAWVDGKRVLVGNRELMVNHGVEVPSNDYEMRYVKDRKNIVYLANSGQLSAMFVISYRPNKQTKEQLDKLSERGMYLIINTSDPNITAEKIHATYDFPMEQIKLMPAKFHAAYENLTAEKDRSPAKIGFIGSSRMMVTAILDCFTARTAIDQAVLIQMIALVAGYALVALFSLMGNLSYLSILHLILFQAVWAIIGTVVPNLKRY